MPKNWWFKFDFKVWRTDADLRKCSLETRGFWLECLCSMHEADTPKIEGTYEEISWLIGCPTEVAARCILELKRTKTADVFLGNGIVKITSRRMKRELKARKQTRLRVEKHRSSNAPVTPQSKSNKKEVISKKKEEREEAEEPPALANQSEPVSIYSEIFPEQNLNFYQQDLITDRISDFIRWRAVLLEWKANGWQSRNIGNILDRYDTFTAREEKYGKPITTFREQREQQAISERNFFDGLRAEIDGADRQLSQTDVIGSSRQLRSIGTESDDSGEGLPC